MTGAKPNIVLVGPGRMGRGMAHAFAYAGMPATVLDMKPRDAGDSARIERELRAEIEGNLSFLSTLGVLTQDQVAKVMALIAFAPLERAEAVLGAADFILEGVPETREAKEDALGRMSRMARPDAVIASTTSTMLVTELQEFVERPERFLNAHFLNPAYLIPLVEVSAGPTTDEAVTARLMALFETAGKVPVRCSASPGYIIPRLQSLIMAEATRMVHEGVASAADIDKAIMNGFGPRYATMGVIEFIDWGGVDIFFYAGNYLAKKLNSPRHTPPPEVETMMKEGRRGMREGQGYYDFRNIDVAAFQKGKLATFVKLLRDLGKLPPPGV